MRAVRGMLAVVAGLLLAGVPLAAQQGGPGGMGRMMGTPNLEELSAKLNLTADQQTRIKALITKFEADTKGVRETLMKNRQAVQSGAADPAALREENMAAMMVLREDADKLNTDIKAVLTPEQQATYDQYLQEQRARMRQGRPGGPPPVR